MTVPLEHLVKALGSQIEFAIHSPANITCSNLERKLRRARPAPWAQNSHEIKDPRKIEAGNAQETGTSLHFRLLHMPFFMADPENLAQALYLAATTGASPLSSPFLIFRHIWALRHIHDCRKTQGRLTNDTNEKQLPSSILCESRDQQSIAGPIPTWRRIDAQFAARVWSS